MVPHYDAAAGRRNDDGLVQRRLYVDTSPEEMADGDPQKWPSVIGVLPRAGASAAMAGAVVVR